MAVNFGTQLCALAWVSALLPARSPLAKLSDPCQNEPDYEDFLPLLVRKRLLASILHFGHNRTPQQMMNVLMKGREI